MKIVQSRPDSLSVLREGGEIAFLRTRMGPTERIRSSLAGSAHAGRVQREIEQAAIETSKQITLDQIQLMGARIRTRLMAEAVPQFASAMADLNTEMDAHDRNLTLSTVQGILGHIENRDNASTELDALERDQKILPEENLAIRNLVAAMVSEDINRSESRMQKAKKAGESLADRAIAGIERAASSVKL